jgi:hypothetical protein
VDTSGQRSGDVAETAEGLGRQGDPVIALEKAKADKEAHGEFQSECPGWGAQDTFFISER